MQNAFSVRLRRYRLLVWCLVLSLAVHFVLLPLVLGLFGLRRPLTEPKETIYQLSSALRIARAPQPRPPQRRVIPQPVQRSAQPHSAQRAHPHPPAPQPQQRRELAKIEPRARIAVPHLPQSMDFAKQQEQFEKTIAQLRRESNPIISAARPVETPEAPKHYTFDFRGSIGSSPSAQGILTPVRSWRDGAYEYYYVQYYVQYADGTTETGYVPWPIRFPVNDDPFAQNWEHVPLPVPLPDYVLPQGTNLHPLVAFCYEHRSQFTTCPIAHD